MAKPKSAAVAVQNNGYTPTKRETAAIERFDKRQAERRKFPKLVATTKDGVADIRSEHADELVAQVLQTDALGIADGGELTSLIKGVFNFTSGPGGKVDAGAANEAFQIIAGLEPRNTSEALLATQMAAIHLASMAAARRLNSTPGNYESIACHGKALNNLTRTFAAQTEAMKKLKGGGQQKVTVEHKHYYLAPGAISHSQAVLGDVSQGRGTNKNEHQPHEHEAGVSERSTVHGHLEADGMPVSGPGSEWLEGVPVSWSQGRGAERVG